MKQAVLALFLVLMMQAPALAAITQLIDSQTVVKEDLVVLPNGLTKLARTKVTQYTYVEDTGAKLTLEYKIPGLQDDRSFQQKHPHIAKYGSMIFGLLLSKLLN